MNAQQPVQEDFSQYEVQPMVDDFQQYEVQPTEESTLAYIGRGASRVASRLGETLVGLPGDVRELAGRGAIKGIEAITGEDQPGLRKRLEENRRAPLSSELREKTASLTGGYTEPQTPGEETADEFLTDVALLGLPIKGKIPFQRAIGTAIAGHLVKEGVEKFGGSETTQDLSKLGTFFLAGLVTPGKTAKTFSDNLYKKRDASLPVGADVDATLLRRNLEGLKKHLQKGTPGAAEKAVIDPIDTLLQKSIGGRIEVEELTTAKRQINSKIGEVIKKEGVKPGDARQMFKRLGKNLEQTIEMYGNQSNKPFLKLHKDANQAHSVLEESKKVSHMVGKMLDVHHLKTPIGTIFTGTGAGALGTAIYHNPNLAGPILGGAAIGYSGVKTFELMNRISKSPVLRKYYQGVISNSLSGNAAATYQNLKNLDEAMAHDLRVHPGESSNKDP